MGQSDYPIFVGEIARDRNRIFHPLLTSKLATMTEECSNHHPFLSTFRSNGLSHSKTNGEPYIEVYQSMPQSHYLIFAGEIARDKKRF